MPIRRLLEGSTLGTDEVEILTRAFDQALRLLSVVDRNDPLTETIARKIVEIGVSVTRDSTEIAKATIKKLNIV